MSFSLRRLSPHFLDRTAIDVESIVRSHDAIPATIAVISGMIQIGMTGNELERLAQYKHAVKVSSRDLPLVISSGKSGGTTVAATSFLASQTGITIFATGGVGGVHRQGHITLDVSADLFQLSRSPIAVISSGVKSILDIPRTLEYLETMGVSVCVYDDGQNETGHQNDETVKGDLYFPAFLSRKSSVKVSSVIKSPEDVAKLIWTRDQLGQSNGILVGNPIPREHQVSHEEAIEEAVKEAERNNITGKDVTPFVLTAVERLTKGSSLKANMALIRNNASLAAKVALSLQHLRNSYSGSDSECHSRNVTSNRSQESCSFRQKDTVYLSHELEDKKQVDLDASHVTRQTWATRTARQRNETRASRTGSVSTRNCVHNSKGSFIKECVRFFSCCFPHTDLHDLLTCFPFASLISCMTLTQIRERKSWSLEDLLSILSSLPKRGN